MQGDPGWRPALRRGWKTTLFMPFALRRSETPLLIQLRTLCVSTIITWSLFGLVVATASPAASRGGVWIPVGVGGASMLAMLVAAKLARRSWAGRDQLSLASEARARFFAGYSISQAPMLAGVLAALVGRSRVSFLIALVGAIACLSVVAPTAAWIARNHASLDTRTLSLFHALMLPSRMVPTDPTAPRE